MDLNQGELLISVSNLLDRFHISYMLTGAWSVIYFGRPRASHDIDFIVEIRETGVPNVLTAMRSLRPEYEFQEESVIDAVKKHGMFNVIYLPTYLKLDFWLLKNDEFDQMRFSRRKRVTFLGKHIEITSAEDTILQKLRLYKEAQIEKHLVDAAFVYQIQNKNIDTIYLNKWLTKLKLANYFKQLQKIDLEKYV